jgi:hypothetical protein
MRTFFVCLLLLGVAACSSTPSEVAELKDEPLRTYDLKGKVINLDNSGTVRLAKIQHEQIGDWMGAMTMDFPVLEPEQFAKLRVGQEVTGKVYVRGVTFWAGDFQEAAPPEAK